MVHRLIVDFNDMEALESFVDSLAFGGPLEGQRMEHELVLREADELDERGRFKYDRVKKYVIRRNESGHPGAVKTYPSLRSYIEQGVE